jgi:hypothetical protein
LKILWEIWYKFLQENPNTKYHDELDRGLCESGMLERPRYFPRQMITADEMTLEQRYFRDKLRRHNRFLHGWGVVCDARVCPVINPKTGELNPWVVSVSPGYVLGPYGDEIIIDCDRMVDLRTTGVTGISHEPSPPPLDPWCSNVDEILIDRQAPVYIAVKYKEVQARPIRVQPVGCGCDDSQCEYSRWRDGYEIGVLPELPESHKNIPSEKPNSGNSNQKEIPKCPPCPSDPWVVLAMVNFDDNSGAIAQIDNYTYRRIVVSHSQEWIALESPHVDNNVEPNRLNQGGQRIELTIRGSNLRLPRTVSFGKGVKISKVNGEPFVLDPQGTSLKVTVNIDEQANIGDHTMTIIDTDCNVIVIPNAISIASAQNMFVDDDI